MIICIVIVVAAAATAAAAAAAAAGEFGILGGVQTEWGELVHTYCAPPMEVKKRPITPDLAKKVFSVPALHCAET
jgi:hypothetical protein